MRQIALLAALAFVLGGCSTDVGPSAAELKAQWEAQNVVPQNYKQDLMAFLRTYLNDPGNLRDTAVSQPVLKKVGEGDRYVACVRYNARDSEHKYTGVRSGAAIYVSGKLDRFIEGSRDGSGGGHEAAALCKDAVYAPFPELARLQR